MTNEDLITEIVNFYRIAKGTTAKYKSPIIKRGRNHTVSSLTEDLLAYFIKKRCNPPFHQIWIDYPISYKSTTKKTKKGNPASETIYPDISIVRTSSMEPEIVCMIDIKMDIGWKRDLSKYTESLIPKINKIRNVKLATYRKLDNNGMKEKNPSKVKISNKLKWLVPLISNQNIGKIAMAKNDEHISSTLVKEALKLYLFTKDIHPNNGEPIINNTDINKFIKEINSTL